MVLKGPSLQQIWMYYMEKLMKNLVDLNTFETSMSLRDQVKASIKTLIPCLFTYVLHYWLNDTLFEIELFPSIVLASRVTNWKDDIHKFLQQFEWLRVNRDSNLHFKGLGAKQT